MDEAWLDSDLLEPVLVQGKAPENGKAGFLEALTGLFARAQQGTQNEVKMIDPSTILFSMSTLADDMAPLEPLTVQPASDDVVLHEDEWRQIEFFPASRLGEVRQTLTELVRFEAENRTEQGYFRRIFIRRLPPPVPAPAPAAVGGLARDLGAQTGPGPVFSTGQSYTGRAAGGFTLRLASNVALYGYADRRGIMVLGAQVGVDGDHEVLTRAFVTLNRSRGLIAVDWREHLLLTGLSADGQIEVWRPD